jgi:hypothetical protein
MLANKQIETKRMETKCGGVRSIRSSRYKWC